jgi:hypothetical protein
MLRLNLCKAKLRCASMAQVYFYYIMYLFFRKSQTGVEVSERSMELTTITYYRVSEVEGFLAVVRFTAYNPDGLPELICEDFYSDSPEEFCRFEADVEKALVSGIDASIMSSYEADTFPVVHTYLTL